MTDDLPTYGRGKIPDGMATMTMLSGLRRRVAPGQPPVGYYPVRGGVVPLYAVADSVTLPPMSDKQLAKWTANRTCARCEEVRADPVPLVDDGRRVDWRCQQAERLAAARIGWTAARVQARAWARDLIAARDGVILVGYVIGRSGVDAAAVELLAVDLRGRGELVDVMTWPSPYRNLHSGGTRWASYPRTVREAGIDGRRLAPGRPVIDADQIVPHLMPLLGRTIGYLTIGGGGHPIGHVAGSSHLWSTWGDNSLFVGAALPHDRAGAGDIAARWRDWLCEPQESTNVWPGPDGLKRQPLEADSAAAGLALAAACLSRMAMDDHPDGPARCPALPDVGLEPCGELANTSGMCDGHAVASLLAVLVVA